MLLKYFIESLLYWEGNVCCWTTFTLISTFFVMLLIFQSRGVVEGVYICTAVCPSITLSRFKCAMKLAKFVSSRSTTIPGKEIGMIWKKTSRYNYEDYLPLCAYNLLDFLKLVFSSCVNQKHLYSFFGSAILRGSNVSCLKSSTGASKRETSRSLQWLEKPLLILTERSRMVNAQHKHDYQHQHHTRRKAIEPKHES